MLAKNSRFVLMELAGRFFWLWQDVCQYSRKARS
jgi:hypothetical protein